jgi:hypothetical protein
MSKTGRFAVLRFGLSRLSSAVAVSAALVVFVSLVLAADTVPTDVEQPGTQPGEGPAISTNCSCHYGTENPEIEPGYGWEGGMMSLAMKDPIFWATVAVAEQDFLPGADPATRGGVGDLCLRCHGPTGWRNGNSTPTDGSAYVRDEERSVECEHCHLMVNPDQPVNIPGTVEAQTAPYEAFDPDTGEGYHGSGQYVLNDDGGTRLGPYAETSATHAFYQSAFIRSGEFCGTCHDVSNPAVGDLAHNNGAGIPLDSGFSGVPGSPVDGKAAFNHMPYAYGVVERTYSEWKASALDDYRVDQYLSLPPDLQHPTGALDLAFHRAFDVVPPEANPNRPNYEDGTVRYFTCQTCHMAASTGVGCAKSGAPTRYDLARHDQTGGGYWMPDVVLYQRDNDMLRFGDVAADQEAAMQAGKSRAAAWLTAAAALDVEQSANDLHVRITNLTGHKLLSGYPEGRRMWMNVKWFDAGGLLVGEEGAYGPIGRTVDDLAGTPHEVESLLDLEHTIVFQAEPGMDQEWAAQLLALGYDPQLPVNYDRMTDAVGATLGDLGAQAPGYMEHSFHFVLNNVMIHDQRIPPYGFDRDEAELRSCLPVPETLYGNPDPGGSYEHWYDAYLPVPAGAVSAEVRLYYQQTSWEYIQFLWLANDGASEFLGLEGVNMLDAWLNTGMSPPLEMALATAAIEVVSGVPGEASHQDLANDHMLAAWNPASGEVEVAYTAACDAVDHTIYYGDLAFVSSYGYTDAACFLGASGTASFDPGSGNSFFLVVANDAAEEGSYGSWLSGGATDERDEASGLPACDYPRNLAGVTCE